MTKESTTWKGTDYTVHRSEEDEFTLHLEKYSIFRLSIFMAVDWVEAVIFRHKLCNTSLGYVTLNKLMDWEEAKRETLADIPVDRETAVKVTIRDHWWMEDEEDEND